MRAEYTDDTIVAIATPPGQGGIGIVRLSGPESLGIAGRIFKAKSGQPAKAFKNFTVHYGWVVADGPDGVQQVVDEALLTVMRAPKSYTCEDVIEISSHAGIVSLNRIVRLAIEQGARPAEPGEFTKRAFLNGRIDLTQAEAVLDIIQARTSAFHHLSLNQLKGELTRELETIREALMEVYVELEAVVNFPEDEINATGRRELRERLVAQRTNIERLLASSDQGKILKEGIKIVLCGKANVGKSSLLNILLKQPRAIVSEIAGTTRDTIEETAQIRGVPFQLVDTAGILEPRDLIEREAVQRSHMYINSADLVILLLDGSRPLSREDEQLFESLRGRNLLVVVNKCDLPLAIDEGRLQVVFGDITPLRISALKKIALSQLEEEILQRVLHGQPLYSHGVLLSNARHIQALTRCREVVERAQDALDQDVSPEFISEEVKTAVAFLDQITGRNIDADLLDSIFSRFCIGK